MTEKIDPVPGGRPVLFLHVGHSKAGSSSIQSLLSQNADEVRRQGLLIANVDLEFPVEGPVFGYPLQIVKQWLETPDLFLTKLRERLGQLSRSLAEGNFRGAIISSEILAAPWAAEYFRKVKEHFEIVVFYYVRRQDHWLESAWKQWALKDGRSLTDHVERSLKVGDPCFLKNARAWREVADTIRVRPVEAIEDVSMDFTGAVGLDTRLFRPVPRQNRTFDWAHLDAISRCPFLFRDTNDIDLHLTLNRLLPDWAPREGHPLLTREWANRVLGHFAEENRQLRDEFFPELPTSEWDSLNAEVDQSEGHMDRFGSTDSLMRNLGLQLALLMSIDKKLVVTDQRMSELGGESLREVTRRIIASVQRKHDRVRRRFDREREKRRALEKRVAELESRTIRRRIARLLRKMGNFGSDEKKEKK